jgi:hypothetical protein
LPVAFSMTTGSTSPTGVPPQPPPRTPVGRRHSSPPPRLLTKSASTRSCSGVNDAASTLPRMIEGCANSSSRVFGSRQQLVLVADVAAPVLVLGGPQQDRDPEFLSS